MSTSLSTLNSDRDVIDAMRGIYKGKYQTFANELPSSWTAQTRNMVIAQQIARDKGYDTSGLDASGSSYSDPDSGAISWIAQHGYLIPLAATGIGAASGAFGAGGGAVTSLGPSTASNIAATTAASSAPSGIAAGTGAAVAGVSSSLIGNLLKYGVPIAGDLIGGAIQSSASSKASDAQQKYLEEALAYQKEQDAFTNKRLTSLDEDARTKFGYGANLEAARYGDYTNRIAPYLATGSSANARMATLLGLQAPSNSLSPYQAHPVPTLGESRTAVTTTAPPQTMNVNRPETPIKMVPMQAPDGTIKNVPENQVEHYTALGAKVAA